MARQLIPGFQREDVFEYQGRRPLDEFIILGRLNTFETWTDYGFTEEHYQQVRSTVRNKLTALIGPEEILESLEAELKPQVSNENKPTLYTSLLLGSIISTTMAELAVGSGEREKAWAHITHTFCSMYEITIDELMHKKENGHQRSGGLGKGKKNIAVVNRAVELLIERKPEGGWKTKKAATKAIVGELESYLKDDTNRTKEGFNLSSLSIENTLKRWLSKEGHPVQAAFEENSSQSLDY